MTDKSPVENARAELEKGMRFKKCRKCGCMGEALDNLRLSLISAGAEGATGLAEDCELWLTEMKPIKYNCLGCKHCYPAVAVDVFNRAFLAHALIGGC